jgi:hypothetical protein
MEAAGYPTLLMAKPMPSPLKICDASFESEAISDLSTDLGCFEIDEDVPVDQVDSEGVASTLPVGDTLIILDFDDTLFPTTWLLNEGFLDGDAALDPVQSALLQRLEDHAAKTLQMAMQYGEVVIITNAMQGWVEHSCAVFMPSLVPFLQQIKIVSARSSYESEDVPSPTSWKTLAFAREVGRFCNGPSEARTIISLGDSLCEQQALVAATNGFADCSAKSLKFMEQPYIEQLIDQHELVHGCFADVYELVGDLDLEVGAA